MLILIWLCISLITMLGWLQTVKLGGDKIEDIELDEWSAILIVSIFFPITIIAIIIFGWMALWPSLVKTRYLNSRRHINEG